MPSVNVRKLAYEGFRINQADFTNGQEESSSVSQGNIGEIGVAEVSSDGQISSFDAVRVGVPAASVVNDVAFVAMDSDDANTDVSDTVEWRLAASDKNRNRRRPLTDWYSQRDSDNSDPRQRPHFSPPSGPFVKNGREVLWEVKDETASVTVDRSGSEFQVPMIGGL